MKIIDQLHSGRISVSCELFPPKPDGPYEEVLGAVRQIAALNPSFMSVTYGAGGGTTQNTVRIAREIQACGITALAHLSCISLTKEQVGAILQELHENGIENVLALRGDYPPGWEGAEPGDYGYAWQLVREIRERGGFCIGAACYPEGHVECEHKQDDIGYLKHKVESGVDFLTTQMFFDNNIYYNFLYRILSQGIRVPVIAGIMPVTNSRQIRRITQLSGTQLPPRFKAIVDRFADNPAAMKQAGIAYATEQIIDLLANGVTAVHIYTMNKPEIAGKIMDNLSEIIR